MPDTIQHHDELIVDVSRRVRQCLPFDRYESFSLHEPSFNDLEASLVLECIRTRWVSYQGPRINEFEQQLATYCQTKHAIAVSSGTVALFVALQALGIGSGDEVLIPSTTFVATANAVHHAGSVAHFVEADTHTLGIDVKKLRRYLEEISVKNADGRLSNRKTGLTIKAIIPVHILGHPVDMDALMDLAQDYGLMVIEDAAEALGSTYKGRPLGGFGAVGILSFNGNKVVTTGGGGALLVQDDLLAKRIKHLTTTAKKNHPYEFFHDEIGFNFRMPNLNAALGCAQMQQVDRFLANKRKLSSIYQHAFLNNPYCTSITEPHYGTSNYWLNAIRLKPQYVSKRNALIETLIADSIFARPLWTPLHRLPMYQGNPRMSDLSVTDDLYASIVCLPSSEFLHGAS